MSTTRRSFLGMLAAIVPAGLVGRLAVAGEAETHIIDVAYWNRCLLGSRLLLDGRDITNRTTRCCISEGWAECYVLDTDGKRFKSNGGFVEAERLHGNLRIVRKSRRELVASPRPTDPSNDIEVTCRIDTTEARRQLEAFQAKVRREPAAAEIDAVATKYMKVICE